MKARKPLTVAEYNAWRECVIADVLSADPAERLAANRWHLHATLPSQVCARVLRMNPERRMFAWPAEPRPVENRRLGDGVKLSSDQYRKGGERVLWLDGHRDELNVQLVIAIRAAGFQCWRTGEQVWVRNDDTAALDAAGLGSAWLSAHP